MSHSAEDLSAVKNMDEINPAAYHNPQALSTLSSVNVELKEFHREHTNYPKECYFNRQVVVLFFIF